MAKNKLVYMIFQRLSGEPDEYRELRSEGEFETEEAAVAHIQQKYGAIDGVSYRKDVFHGFQPLKVIPQVR